MDKRPDPYLPFLDGIVDEVLRGERIILFPPGTWAFSVANVGLLLGNGLLSMTALPALADGLITNPPVLVMGGLAVTLVSTVVPAFMVAHGISNGRPIFMGLISLSVAAGALTVVASTFSTMTTLRLPAALALGILGCTAFIARTRAYHSFALFKLRLRSRRKMLRVER